MTKQKVTGIILAGGKSSRLGEEKGLAHFHKKPLVSYAIETLKPICSEIIISANIHLNEYSAFGFPVVQDEFKNVGPIGGLSACLKQSTSQYNFVLSCDTPFVDPHLYTYLIKNIENFQAAVPLHHNNLIEPLCACYASNVIWDMERNIEKGNYKMHDFLDRINCKIIEITDRLSFYSDELFVNINTQKDLAGGRKRN